MTTASLTLSADGLLSYATDPDATGAELLFAFVEGRVGLAIAGEPTPTNAPATTATATGAANNATVMASAPATVAAGTGAGNAATTKVSGSVNVAAVTGAANNATVTVAPADGSATGSGTAYAATVKVSTNTVPHGPAGYDGHGDAEPPRITVSPEAQPAAAVGAAYAVARLAGLAAGTGTADGAQPQIFVSAGFAAGVGAANTVVYTVVQDPNARTVTVRDHGHTVTLQRRR